MSIDTLLGCEKRWVQAYYVAFVSCQPGIRQKSSCQKIARLLQGPGTAGMMEWRFQARVAIGHSKRRRPAAGLNALPPCVDGCAGWRVNGLSCAGRKPSSPSSGAWPTKGYRRATRRLPAWVTAGKGPVVPGRSRGQNQQVPGWLILLIAPSSGRHT
jgi:hypothetical protein